MKDLIELAKRWWDGRCLKCGGAFQLRAFVSCKGENWVMIHRHDQVCLGCGAVKEK